MATCSFCLLPLHLQAVLHCAATSAGGWSRAAPTRQKQPAVTASESESSDPSRQKGRGPDVGPWICSVTWPPHAAAASGSSGDKQAGQRIMLTNIFTRSGVQDNSKHQHSGTTWRPRFTDPGGAPASASLPILSVGDFYHSQTSSQALMSEKLHNEPEEKRAQISFALSTAQRNPDSELCQTLRSIKLENESLSNHEQVY